jgi:hypothetical protein
MSGPRERIAEALYRQANPRTAVRWDDPDWRDHWLAMADAVLTASNWTCGVCGHVCRHRYPRGPERRDAKAELLRRSKLIRRKQSRTLEGATNFGKQWTGAELEIASRSELSHREVAAMLGRTFYAVRTMRRRLRSEPIKVLTAGAARKEP